MKNCSAFLIFAAAVLTATWVFAQANDPESYRQALLSPARALQGATAAFCQAKAGASGSYQDCQVTINFLIDIARSQGPADQVCPRGASIQYAGNPVNQDKITKRCT